MELKDQIIEIVNTKNYQKGLNYNFDAIELIKIIHMNNKSKIFKFEVESERTFDIYNVDITTQNNDVILTYCSCPQYKEHQKCKHIAACLIKENKKIFNFKTENKKQNLSITIFENLLKNNIEKNYKLNLQLELNFKKNYYGSGLYVKFKVGIDKLYSATSTSKYFFDLYNGIDEDILYFGKNFTYDPNTQYFDDIDKKIIDFLSNEYYHYREMRYYDNDIYIYQIISR